MSNSSNGLGKIAHQGADIGALAALDLETGTVGVGGAGQAEVRRTLTGRGGQDRRLSHPRRAMA